MINKEHSSYQTCQWCWSGSPRVYLPSVWRVTHMLGHWGGVTIYQTQVREYLHPMYMFHLYSPWAHHSSGLPKTKMYLWNQQTGLDSYSQEYSIYIEVWTKTRGLYSRNVSLTFYTWMKIKVFTQFMTSKMIKIFKYHRNSNQSR